MYACTPPSTLQVPIYDFSTHQRSSEVKVVQPADVIILEGMRSGVM
jgi:uridine kinase